MSSASKLRQAIMSKRKSMSVLNPDVKRRKAPGGIKMGGQEREPEQPVDEMEEKLWETVIDSKVQALLATYVSSCAKQTCDRAHHLSRITTNVRLWVSSARQAGCTGTEKDHQHAPTGCPGRFTPSTFFDCTHFAHWKKHKVASNGKSHSTDTINTRARCSSTDTFRAFMTGATAHGRVLWQGCHKVESVTQSKRPAKKRFV
jgi:hypothetical protein